MAAAPATPLLGHPRPFATLLLPPPLLGWTPRQPSVPGSRRTGETNQRTLSPGGVERPSCPTLGLPLGYPQSQGRLHCSPLCDPRWTAAPCKGSRDMGGDDAANALQGLATPWRQHPRTPRPRPGPAPSSPNPRLLTRTPPPGPPLPPADPPLSCHAARAPVPRGALPAAGPLPRGASPGHLPAAPGAPGPAARAAWGPGGLPRAGGPVPGVRALGRAAAPGRPVLPPGGLPREPGSGLPGWEREGRALRPRGPRSPALQDPSPRRCPA